MPDMMFQALDLTGLNETAEQVRAIVQAAKSEIESELDSLDYAQPDGIYPYMTVGTVIGADETAQWATRESTGSGSAIVRSVKGAAVVWNQYADAALEHLYKTRVSVAASGTLSTITTSSSSSIKYAEVAFPEGHKVLLIGDYTAPQSTLINFGLYAPQGTEYGNRSSVGAGETASVREIYTMTSTYNAVRVINFTTSTESGVSATVDKLQLIDLTLMFGAGNEPTTVEEFEAMFPLPYYPYSAPTLKPVHISGIRSTDAQGNALDSVEWPTQTLRAAGSVADVLYADHVDVNVGERAYQSGDESDATVRTDGTTTYYPLVTPTTTPISPALSMTYRVQAGGSESIIVPEGEVSAAPILTVAEPVNMSTELAQIWAAIEALQGNRGSALESVRSASDVSGTEVKEAPTMDEKQTTERESEI